MMEVRVGLKRCRMKKCCVRDGWGIEGLGMMRMLVGR
jgi:hypothetical protein